MERIYGRRPVIDALQSNQSLERVYIQDSISGDFEKQVRALCMKNGVPLNRIPKIKLDRDIKGNHQGIYAVASLITYVEIGDLIADLRKEEKKPVLLLLDGVMDVRNLGAIARSAEVFGADALILPNKKMAPVNDVAIKTSAGALMHLPICRVKNLHSALDHLCAQGFEVLGAEANGNKLLDSIDLNVPLAIVLGGEGRGIDRNLGIYFDHHVRIPQSGKTQSLNVSVAGGIMLYEVFKQRNAIDGK